MRFRLFLALVLFAATITGSAQSAPPVTLDASGHMAFWNGTAWVQLANVADLPVPAPSSVTPVAVDPTPVKAPVMTAAAISLGNHGDLNGFQPFAGAPWTQPVTSATIDPVFTAAWVKENGSSYVHPDFGAAYGIPYVVADGTVTAPASVAVSSTAAEATPAESDITVAPIPANAPIEGSPAAGTITGDNHLLVVRRDDASLVELYHAMQHPDGTYTSDSTALWDMQSSAAPSRPFGYTSADAAGLPIFPLLVKHEEFTKPVMATLNGVQVATLGHALRMTANNIRAAYYASGDPYGGILLPATHSAPNNSGTSNLAGMRLRLDPAFDASSLSGLALILANTLKVYGCYVADLGSTGFFTGSQDERWTDADTAQTSIPLSSFQVVAFDHVYSTATPDLTQVKADLTGKVFGPPTGTPPVIASFTQANGTLTWQVTGATYLFIDKIGLVRGTSIAAAPGAYTLTASNPYGRVTKVVAN